MSLDRKSWKLSHKRFFNLPDLLKKGDALVLNETRVIPTRLEGRTANGGKIEFLLTASLDDGLKKGMVKGLKKLKPGQSINFGNNLSGEFVSRDGDFGLFRFDMEDSLLRSWMETHAHIPLPPYIDREDDKSDRERYQTVYSNKDGSCAAPTAGLHFTEELLAEIKKKGIRIFRICLHVGPGTFKPITAGDIAEHKLDPEYAEVPQETYDELMRIKSHGGRVIAVGTTATRALETSAKKGGGFAGPTDLFIYPGFHFKMADGLITNFHLPESSLLALVSAFVGDREKLLDTYRAAIKEGYRFYSYGDAMLIL